MEAVISSTEAVHDVQSLRECEGAEMMLTALCGIALVMQVGGRIRKRVPWPISTPESRARILQ